MTLDLIDDGAPEGSAEVPAGPCLVVPHDESGIDETLVHRIGAPLLLIDVLQVGIALLDQALRAIRHVRPIDEGRDDGLAMVLVLGGVTAVLLEPPPDVFDADRNAVDWQAHGRHARIVFHKGTVIHGLFADEVVPKELCVLPHNRFGLLKHVLSHVFEEFDVPPRVLVGQYLFRERNQDVVPHHHGIDEAHLRAVVFPNDVDVVLDVPLRGEYEETPAVPLQQIGRVDQGVDVGGIEVLDEIASEGHAEDYKLGALGQHRLDFVFPQRAGEIAGKGCVCAQPARHIVGGHRSDVPLQRPRHVVFGRGALAVVMGGIGNVVTHPGTDVKGGAFFRQSEVIGEAQIGVCLVHLFVHLFGMGGQEDFLVRVYFVCRVQEHRVHGMYCVHYVVQFHKY
mmetsp:Transcript_18928/g.43916  ORF Transcript_18928/g.43916 Transcript_18928/m.43916 type:complete len:395 (+) Transcript_18928:925-2109(+)